MDGITYYGNVGDFITSATDRAARIANIRAVMAALRNQRLLIAQNPQQVGVQEYSLDDGQTKIRTVFRDLASLDVYMRALERDLQYEYNQGRGRMTRLMPEANFKNTCNG